jgi:hypothetical protein
MMQPRYGFPVQQPLLIGPERVVDGLLQALR